MLSRLNLPFKDAGTQALIVTQVVENLLRFSSSLILTRLLNPEAFSITLLAGSIMMAFAMVSDGGFRAFILRHKEGDEDYLLGTVWTVKLIRNLLLVVLMYSFSEPIANYFNIKELELVLQILCLGFLFDGLLPIAYIAVERHNKVAIVLYLRGLSKVLAVIFSVIGVYYYKSFWPIIYSMVLDYVLQLLFGYWFLGRKGTIFSLNKAVLVEFLGWVKYIIPSSIITLILVQLDKLILGKAMTAVELGLYALAITYSAAATTFVIRYARSVLMPYASTVYREEPNNFVEKFYARKTKIVLLLALCLGALSGGSYLFYDVLYDPRYLSASYYLSIILVVPIMCLVSYTAEVSLILHGQVKMTLIANIIRVVWFLSSAWFGYSNFGVIGLLVAIALIELFPTIYMMFKLKMINRIKIGLELLVFVAAFAGFAVAYSLTFLIYG